jgi:hypothetical protein
MKKILRYTIFCTAWLCGFFGVLPASGQFEHEFSLYGGGGLSTFSYTLPQGRQEPGLGGNVGLGYVRFVMWSFGMSTGVSLATYSATARLDGVHSVTISGLKDADGDTYNLSSTLVSYREQQRATFIHVPLMLSYQNARRRPFYAQAGLKVSIPLSARYESRDVAIHNEGYYPNLDASMSSGPPYLGFGMFTGKNAEGTIDMKMIYTAAVEAGVKWKLARALFLYAGVYVDYGLNEPLLSPHSTNIVEPNPTAPADFAINSVLTSRYAAAADNNNHVSISKMSLMSMGMKIRIAFGVSPFDAYLLPADVRQEQEAADAAADAAAARLQQEEAAAAAARLQQEAAAAAARLQQEAAAERQKQKVTARQKQPQKKKQQPQKPQQKKKKNTSGKKSSSNR